MGFTVKISVSDADKERIQAAVQAKIDEIKGNVGPVLYEGGELIATSCKEECPVGKVNGGTLRSSISVEQISDTEVHIAPHTFYAIWVEFGHHSWTGDPYMHRGVEASRNDVSEYIRSSLVKS